MKNIPLPAGSREYAERAFVEKEKLRQRRARWSFTRKIKALDRLLELSKDLPKLEGADG